VGFYHNLIYWTSTLSNPLDSPARSGTPIHELLQIGRNLGEGVAGWGGARGGEAGRRRGGGEAARGSRLVTVVRGRMLVQSKLFLLVLHPNLCTRQHDPCTSATTKSLLEQKKTIVRQTKENCTV